MNKLGNAVVIPTAVLKDGQRRDRCQVVFDDHGIRALGGSAEPALLDLPWAKIAVVEQRNNWFGWELVLHPATTEVTARVLVSYRQSPRSCLAELKRRFSGRTQVREGAPSPWRLAALPFGMAVAFLVNGLWLYWKAVHASPEQAEERSRVGSFLTTTFGPLGLLSFSLICTLFCIGYAAWLVQRRRKRGSGAGPV